MAYVKGFWVNCSAPSRRPRICSSSNGCSREFETVFALLELILLNRRGSRKKKITSDRTEPLWTLGRVYRPAAGIPADAAVLRMRCVRLVTASVKRDVRNNTSHLPSFNGAKLFGLREEVPSNEQVDLRGKKRLGSSTP